MRLLADKTIKCLANTHPVNEYGNGNHDVAQHVLGVGEYHGTSGFFREIELA